MGTQSIEVLRSISEVPIPETLLQGSDFSQVPEKIKKALEALESAEKTAKSYTDMPWYKQIINVVSGEALFDTMTIEKTLLESQKLLTWLMVISIMLTKEIRDHQIQIHDLHDQIYDVLWRPSLTWKSWAAPSMNCRKRRLNSIKRCSPTL
ncbi:hypothetical protein [Kyrpidia sp.]|uniref:hypothetical protein n=1 Tax=Kyrpidia sp. TaxID=2073077 RepID=UPI0025842F18|nr:hypothetical protein [Kyrpidia sp.]MCL6576908.1 hypothetical protein [Kyrpidia sp.]